VETAAFLAPLCNFASVRRRADGTGFPLTEATEFAGVEAAGRSADKDGSGVGVDLVKKRDVVFGGGVGVGITRCS
jgi:hypothetical protein